MTRSSSTARVLGPMFTPLFALCGLLATSATAGSPVFDNPAGGAPIGGQSVYRAFHEQPGIDRIIDDSVARWTVDPRIARRFAGRNLVRLRLELKAQVCYLVGGPCAYEGKDMRAAHAGMGLENRDFNALAEDLQLAMDKEHVPFSAQNRLLAKLAPMQRAIVSR